MLVRENWDDEANCLGVDLEVFFRNNSHAKALAICKRCPVMLECREMTDREETQPEAYYYGVFGGETPAQRKRRRRKIRKQMKEQVNA